MTEFPLQIPPSSPDSEPGEQKETVLPDKGGPAKDFPLPDKVRIRPPEEEE